MSLRPSHSLPGRANDPLKVGAVEGDYRIDAPLGIGGMGSVAAATDLRDGTRVALKVMLPRHAENKDLRARFAREARTSQMLKSERTVRVLGAGTLADGLPYIVMELLTGATFDELLRTGPLPISQAVGYIIEVCDAIAEAHAYGVVHRDIKPGNLFLAEREGQPPIVKVLDFGISKAPLFDLDNEAGECTSLTATDSLLGSPSYMSPEQLRSSKHVDGRTDIWSLGLVLHRLIAGKPAFPAQNMGEHLVMITSELPTPLSEHRPDAPYALEEVILQCLRRSPNERYPTVGQLVTALAPFGPPEVQPIVERIGEEIEPAFRTSLWSADTVIEISNKRLDSPPPPPPAPPEKIEQGPSNDATVVGVTRDPRRVGAGRRGWVLFGGAASLVGLFFGVVWTLSHPGRTAQSVAADWPTSPPGEALSLAADAPAVSPVSSVDQGTTPTLTPALRTAQDDTPVPAVATVRPVSYRGEAPSGSGASPAGVIRSKEPRSAGSAASPGSSTPPSPASSQRPLKGPVEREL